MISHPRSSLILALLGLALAGAPALSAPAAPEAADFVGTWRGALAVGDVRLRLVFHLRPGEEGLEATIDSPDQGVESIPVAVVEVDGDSLRLDVAAIRAVYAGRLDGEERTLDGEWRQSGQVLPLSLERAEPESEEGR